MTDTYTGIEITEQLQAGNSLPSSIAGSTIRTEYIDDSYPEWHPAPDSFLGMVRLLIYRKITGESYRALARYQELAEPFGLDHIPDESVLSRTWRNRFDDGVREFVRSASHFVVKEVHDREFSAPAVRPKSEVVDEQNRSPKSGTPTRGLLHRCTRISKPVNWPRRLLRSSKTSD
ncbi:hypothetical protein [Natronococcus wangiae]|uniref:hypothetical protein n=1 Tax=Natronococcus wangiae TaxID=3068275 RepID=UPI00273D2E33|nr:hypothetical protein [Natronococcus sp. AD5]